MSKRLRQEDGIALVMALSITVVLIIFVSSMIAYTTSNSRASTKSSGDLMAKQYADAGLNTAYSIIVNQNVTSGGNPAAANLLGCNGAGGAADTTGPSNCTTPSPKVVCVTTSGCVSGDSGSATVYGYYSGVNPGTYNGVTVPTANWLLVSSGYARNPAGAMIVKTSTALVAISALNSGAVAAVWNHMFLTSPLVPNTCSVDFGGNNMTITDPIYAIGNVCVSGQNTTIAENAGGQPVDLMIGGKLSMSGSGTTAGTSGAHLTSGVVVGGCTLGNVTTATSACGPATNYYVNSTDTFIPQDAPEMLAADITERLQQLGPRAEARVRSRRPGRDQLRQRRCPERDERVVRAHPWLELHVRVAERRGYRPAELEQRDEHARRSTGTSSSTATSRSRDRAPIRARAWSRPRERSRSTVTARAFARRAAAISPPGRATAATRRC